MKRRGLAANSAFALGGDLAGKLATVALTIVAARVLSIGEFAVWASAIAAVGLLSVALDGGAQATLTRDGTSGPGARGRLFRALAVGRGAGAVALLGGAPLVGLLVGRPVEAFAVGLLAVLSAASLSLTGVIRSAQDLRPEATSKLVAALLSVAGGSLACVAFGSARALLLTLAAASTVSLLPLAARARRVASFEAGAPVRAALRRAAPLGLMALATIAFYRTGTLALASFSTAPETAAFAIASSLGFGLLVLPNAITTGLLPRLAEEKERHVQAAIARRALVWTLVLTVPVCSLVALVAPFGLPLVFGNRYAGAAAPLAILCGGAVLIAFSGVVGTALIAIGHLRLLAVQVGVSLGVNVAALALLVPRLGASGAALATISCEAVGASILAFAAARHLPGLLTIGRHGSPVVSPGAPAIPGLPGGSR